MHYFLLARAAEANALVVLHFAFCDPVEPSLVQPNPISAQPPFVSLPKARALLAIHARGMGWAERRDGLGRRRNRLEALSLLASQPVYHSAQPARAASGGGLNRRRMAESC